MERRKQSHKPISYNMILRIRLGLISIDDYTKILKEMRFTIEELENCRNEFDDYDKDIVNQIIEKFKDIS